MRYEEAVTDEEIYWKTHPYDRFRRRNVAWLKRTLLMRPTEESSLITEIETRMREASQSVVPLLTNTNNSSGGGQGRRMAGRRNSSAGISVSGPSGKGDLSEEGNSRKSDLQTVKSKISKY